MRSGLYRTKDGDIVSVSVNDHGWIIRYTDGRAVVVWR